MINPLNWLGPLAQVIASLEEPTAPTAVHGDVTFTGVASDAYHSFLGIPFAEAPRFAPPIPVTYTGDVDATAYGAACIQHNQLATATDAMKAYLQELGSPLPPPPTNTSESCLSINVIRPATTTASSNLPVIVWFYGGGFVAGDDQTWDNMGKQLIDNSISTSQEVIFVSFNYRLSAYGFLGGDEVQAAGAGNVGLRDQRAALEWVHKYISAFGGNPGRVILWGQSAGAISASLQLLAYDGDSQGLFHGAFLQSGAPLPLGNIQNQMGDFNALADAVGCSKAPSKLRCLRNISIEKLKRAVDATPGIFSENALLLSWRPSADGDFLTDMPQKLVQQGKIADVPIVTGNMDDEGTMFSIAKTGSITTEAQFRDWISTKWMPTAHSTEIDRVLEEYPATASVGSPFNTSNRNQYGGNTQYKRISAFQGDMVFQAPRRFFAKELAMSTTHTSKVWVYLSKRLKGLPDVGSMHGGDVSEEFAPDNNIFSKNAVRFAHRLDPSLWRLDNLSWPAYDVENPKLWLVPAIIGSLPYIANDTHREEPFELLNELGLKYPI